MPFTKDTNIKLDFRGITTYDAKNQHAPFLLSNMGRYIWCDEGLAFEFKDGKIYAEGENIDIYEAGKTLKDAFMLGDKYLVAPVITKGATKWEIQLPKGFVWKYVDGTLYQGGKCVVVDAPLSVLPYFEKISE